ncbi:MAG: transcription elongation factor GreA, partial [Candidatus Saccharimonadales bacterium]
MGRAHHLTSIGLEKLEEELSKLKARRSQVAAKIKEAKAEGDLSENADYTSARGEQDYVLSKIAEIESILQNAVIISDPKNNSAVELGNKVELTCDGKKVIYTV